MKAFQIGLSALVLTFAAACGSDDDGTMDAGATTGSGGTAGSTGTAGGSTSGTGANASGSGTTGDPTSGGSSSTGGSTGTTGSSGTTGASTTGSDDDGGPEPSGACTNAADKAIVDAATIKKLACEGAACAGMAVLDAAKQTKCIAETAPTLKQLSKACQKCFDDITTCVPNKCVFGGSGGCSLTLPNTDFAKCPLTTAPEASCEACQMRECAPAFTTCSGISM
jgi:hypothetical protein